MGRLFIIGLLAWSSGSMVMATPKLTAGFMVGSNPEASMGVISDTYHITLGGSYQSMDSASETIIRSSGIYRIPIGVNTHIGLGGSVSIYSGESNGISMSTTLLGGVVSLQHALGPRVLLSVDFYPFQVGSTKINSLSISQTGVMSSGKIGVHFLL